MEGNLPGANYVDSLTHSSYISQLTSYLENVTHLSIHVCGPDVSTRVQTVSIGPFSSAVLYCCG
jgi:hypothetical protein